MRARKIVVGETLQQKIRSKEVHLVLVAGDASIKTKKMYQDKCTYYHVPMITFGTREKLSKAIGKTNNVAIGITDSGLAKKVYDQLKEVVS